MSGQAGFTLAEALVGLAVGAIAVTAAGMGVTAALNARGANLEASYLVEDLAAAASLQRRLIAQAVPVKDDSADGAETGYRFEADASSVRFIAALWGDPGEAGLWEVSLAITGGERRSTLVVSGRPYEEKEPGEAREPTTSEVVLAEAETSAGASFSYAGRDDEGALEWSNGWTPEDGWPALVAFDPDGQGPAPASVVALATVQTAPSAVPPQAMEAIEAMRRSSGGAIDALRAPARGTRP